MQYQYPILSITENISNELLGKTSSYSSCGHPALIAGVDDVHREKYILPLCSHMFMSPSSFVNLVPINNNNKIIFCSIDKIIICSDEIFNMIVPSKDDKRRPISKKAYNDIMIRVIFRNSIMSKQKSYDALIENLLNRIDTDIEDGKSLPSIGDILKGHQIKDTVDFTDVVAKFDETLLEYLSFYEVMHDGLNYKKIKQLLSTFDINSVDKLSLRPSQKDALKKVLKNRIKELTSLAIQMAATHVLEVEEKKQFSRTISKDDNNKYESYISDVDIKTKTDNIRTEYYCRLILSEDEELEKLRELSNSNPEYKEKYEKKKAMWLSVRKSTMMIHHITEKTIQMVKERIESESSTSKKR